jgi:bacillithiol synthase
VSLTSLLRPRSIGGAPLVRDYLRDAPTAGSFYSGSPYSLDSFQAKLEEVGRRFGPDERRRAASALRPTSSAAADRLQRFVAEGGAVVTTGQQAGFLTGPLYTLYKAVSTVRLAAHLEQRFGTVVLPVFWVASDDHDWAEVNHAVVLDRRGRLHRFALADGSTAALPMSERPLPAGVETVCDEVEEVVVGKGNGDQLIRRILDAYRVPGRTVAEAFNEAIGGLLGGFDLLLADAADPAIKRISMPVLAEALKEARAHERMLRVRSEALEASGYRSQVPVLARGTNVFHHGERGRERLYRATGGFVGREGGGVRSDEQVLDLLGEDPSRFSPNVLLRPVVESAVFPTLAYVGGPGEIAYFGQVGALFDAYGIRPPVVVPRFSGTAVEPAVERLMEDLGLEGSELAGGREALRDRLARRELPAGVTVALEQIRGELVHGYELLMEQAGAMDPTLTGALGAIRNRSLADSRRSERKIVRAIKRRESIVFGQLDRVLDSLRPEGKPQDRVLNVLPYLARFGEHFLGEIDGIIAAEWRLPG